MGIVTAATRTFGAKGYMHVQGAGIPFFELGFRLDLFFLFSVSRGTSCSWVGEHWKFELYPARSLSWEVSGSARTHTGAYTRTHYTHITFIHSQSSFRRGINTSGHWALFFSVRLP